MQEYDYRAEVDIEGKVLAEVERLNTKQRRKVYESLLDIKKVTEQETITEKVGWFELAIVPVLKEFAEISSALLEIQTDERGIIEATLKSSYGMDITDNCRGISMVLSLAMMVSINAEGDFAILELTFDPRQFVN